ncbi:helix-turn-helix domain-containing protein [Sessilibacter corallicola]|uniref:Helix-turn-helix transcriptional regulator n=1 Tax=Sessilibacter corallicola TaxID=2904075 RepID=A0ABQ0A9W9_9GAMM
MSDIPQFTSHYIDQHIGAQLRAFRKLRGLSQQQLGQVLGVTFQQIQKYESGSNRLSSGKLYILHQVLDVPLIDFFEGLEKKDQQKTELAIETAELVQCYRDISSYEKRRIILSLLKAMV